MLRILLKSSMNIVIGIPTTESSDYIYKSLVRIYDEILRCNDKIYHFRVVLCINGNHHDDVAKEVYRFFRDYNIAEEYYAVLVNQDAGKNNAVNRIVQYARNLGDIDIIHFFDDDVVLKRGSLSCNLKALITHERQHAEPALVGSAYIAEIFPFRHFLKLSNPLGAFMKWMFHRIISQPYRITAPRPKFCEGPSFCVYLKYMPSLPDDALGITDDAFLSNYFAIQGKEYYQKYGVLPIIKPQESVSYIKLPLSYGEWMRQQIRVHAGIERAFQYFSVERTYLEKVFAWEYAFNKLSRIPLVNASISQRILRAIYMLLHDINRRVARKYIKQNSVPVWAIAKSTKK